MKYIEEYLKDVIKIKPLGELTTKDDVLVGMSGEMVYIDGKCSDIFISHADYANWLEDKYEQKSVVIIPKFKVGDWVVDEDDNSVHQIKCVLENVASGNFSYDLVGGGYFPSTKKNYHLWSIKDAKPGDVLVHNGCTFIFMGIKNSIVQALEENLLEGINPVCFGEPNKDGDYHPATKEQRETLMKAMTDAGYEWDSNKKELKLLITNGGDITEEPDNKIKPSDEFAGLTDFERTLADICIGWIGEEPGWKQYIKDNAEALLKIAIEKFNSVQDTSFEQKSAEWCEEDEGFLKLLLAIFTNEHPNGLFSTGNIGNCVTSNEIITWLKSIKDKIQLKSAKWNEEDDKRLKSCLNILQPKTLLGNTETINTKWLKSLKQRMGWKPNKEQMHYLNWLANVKLGDSVVEQEVSKHLNELYEDLKKL